MSDLDCGGKGCGTDATKACLRCCRILLSNYDANHGDRCDAEQERLRKVGADALDELHLIRLHTDAGVHPNLPEWVKGRISDFQNLIDEYSAAMAVLDQHGAPDTDQEGEELDIDKRIQWIVDEHDKLRRDLLTMTVSRDAACREAREGYSRGWDGLDQRDAEARIAEIAGMGAKS